MPFWKRLLNNEPLKTTQSLPILVVNQRVIADATRCVQCGICGYNCPVGINVRAYAHKGLTVTDENCIGCRNCVNLCPRGTLRMGVPEEVKKR